MSLYTKLHPDHFNSILGLNSKICSLQTSIESVLQALLQPDTSKMNRIQGSSNYSRAISYSPGTTNVILIVHTGTTALGIETITETFTYVNPAVNGSNITSITYS